MSGALPETTAAAGAEVEFVGFWYRLGSVLWDGVLAGTLAAGLVAVVVGGQLDQPHGQALAGLLAVCLMTVWWLGSWILFGRTPGKWLCSQRIVTLATGRKPGPLRCLARLLSWPLGALAFFLVLRDPWRRGLHDRIAGTCVVADESMARPRRPEGQRIAEPPWRASQP